MKIYVQIGACVGDRDTAFEGRDGFSEYVKSRTIAPDDRILLVEPNPVHLPALARAWRRYSQAEIYAIGICPPSAAARSLTFYYAAEDGPTFHVFSLDPQHVRNHYPDAELLQTTVECLSLNEFLDEAVGGAPIALLSLDIEGIDAEVILSTDWSRVDCELLSFEHLHLGERRGAVAEHLEAHGFGYLGRGVDHIGCDHLYGRSDVAIH